MINRPRLNKLISQLDSLFDKETENENNAQNRQTQMGEKLDRISELKTRIAQLKKVGFNTLRSYNSSLSYNLLLDEHCIFYWYPEKMGSLLIGKFVEGMYVNFNGSGDDTLYTLTNLVDDVTVLDVGTTVDQFAYNYSRVHFKEFSAKYGMDNTLDFTEVMIFANLGHSFPESNNYGLRMMNFYLGGEPRAGFTGDHIETENGGFRFSTHAEVVNPITTIDAVGTYNNLEKWNIISSTFSVNSNLAVLELAVNGNQIATGSQAGTDPNNTIIHSSDIRETVTLSSTESLKPAFYARFNRKLSQSEILNILNKFKSENGLS